ncbi:phage holin family protein [Sphaerisporangium rubeum]|uniref:Putative membrane protein YqjE n=1 Tax=Sphaerisporangium rubeum TaxID=321317 RepID=A0A7X0M658_9ACTN|nr:phage holin family protein [Sphaerisporangium rubeum]MBB6473373.1 putative membrane protein YqjE [Sphaerisporangium rubeum]
MTTLNERENAANPYSSLSTGELVKQMSEDVSRLVRDEIRLAALELSRKGKRAGLGAGMFGGAGVLALYGGGALIAAVILALALVVPGWLAALIVGAVLLLLAGVLGLGGKRQVSKATPPLPTQTIESIKADLDAVKQGAHR